MGEKAFPIRRAINRALTIPAALTPFFPRAARRFVQEMLGQVGAADDRAVTTKDLIDSGLVTRAEGQGLVASNLGNYAGQFDHKAQNFGYTTGSGSFFSSPSVMRCDIIASGKPILIMAFIVFWETGMTRAVGARIREVRGSPNRTVQNFNFTGSGSQLPQYSGDPTFRKTAMFMAIDDEPDIGHNEYLLNLDFDSVSGPAFIFGYDHGSMMCFEIASRPG